MSLADQKTHPSYLHLAAQISFYENGLPFPTSSCKVITSPRCLMLPLQNNITSQPQQPVQNIEVLQVIVVRKRNILMMEAHAFEHSLVTAVGCITVLLL